MPDLGRYAFEVLLAYGGSLAALIAIVWISMVRARRIRETLEQAEARWKNG